jgi:predicted DNA-binding antitoxin AbrB/MazE fold protein
LSKSKVIRVRYEKDMLRPLEPIELREGEEILVRIEGFRDRRRIVEEFYGKRGPAPKELLDEFMLKAELSDTARHQRYRILPTPCLTLCF